MTDTIPPAEEPSPPVYYDRKSVCFFQGKNGYGEPLPTRAAFKPFFAHSFSIPDITVERFADIRSWCNVALGEMDEGRWTEDFDHWHLGDPAAAEWFEETFITPRLSPWAAPVVTERND